MPEGRNADDEEATSSSAAPVEVAVVDRDSRLTRVTRARIVAAIGVLVIVGTLGAFARVGAPFGDPWLVTAFLAFQAVSWAVAVHLQPSDSKFVQQFDEAVFAAGVLLLPPAGVVLALGVGSGLGWFRTRPRAMLINGGVMTLAALAGVGVVVRVEGSLGATIAVAAAAALVGTVVLAICNETILALCTSYTTGEPFLPAVAEFLRFRLNAGPFLVLIGLLAGVSGWYVPWMPVLAIPLLAGLQVVLAQYARATRDRARTQGLFESSVQVHGHVNSLEVEQELTAAAARLLRCTEARVASEPPRDGEWGAVLHTEGGAEKWLVVTNPTNRLPLDPEALRLLETLAAVGSSAMENARLVEEIRRAGLVDGLTGLPNHVLFEDRVAQAATAARRNRERFAVMMLDLDHFKKVNDSLGHSIGNEMLKVAAGRLLVAARDIDTVARMGSDHFIILLPGVGSADTAGVIAEKLLSALRPPMLLGGHELFMTASVGIAFFPEDGTKAEHLLRNADSAMHRAKEHGRDRFETYASGMNDLAQLRLVRESELHLAIQRNELRLRYQPQIDLKTGRILGVEALVRWEHPVLGLIGPNEFVPLAEESGLIVAVDEWVMNEACRQGRAWLDADVPPIRIAVNISGRHFHSSARLVELVERTLGLTGLPAESLELEVTEGIAVGDEEITAQALNRIRDLGVHLAIDDFGTGYSVLGRLRSFPIDRLKIDRSFINEILSRDVEAPIVSAMIAMAHSLQMDCVAEGVETVEQQVFLRSRGCDQAQGFLYSHPVEPDEIVELLTAGARGFDLTVTT